MIKNLIERNLHSPKQSNMKSRAVPRSRPAVDSVGPSQLDQVHAHGTSERKWHTSCDGYGEVIAGIEVACS